eukprot:scaffold2.g7075.t1
MQQDPAVAASMAASAQQGTAPAPAGPEQTAPGEPGGGASCGHAYWCRLAFVELNAVDAARQLSQLVGLLPGSTVLGEAAVAEVPRTGAAAAAAAAGSPAAGDREGAGSSSAGVKVQPRRWGQGLEEGALLLSRVHHPFANLSWICTAIDALGAELRRRMAAAGVACPGLPAVRLLDDLLFANMPTARHAALMAIPPPEGYGLGLEGNRDNFYDPANSLLEHVLASREGIPISIGVLHAAVGARAGLAVQLLNVPQHVVVRCVWEEGAVAAADAQQPQGQGQGQPQGQPQGQGQVQGQGQMGQGQPQGQEEGEVFVDVFDRGQEMDRAQLDAFMRMLGLDGGFDPSLVEQPMTPQQVYGRMSRNLLHIHRERGDGGLYKATALLAAALHPLRSVDGMRTALELVNACLVQEQYEEATAVAERVAAVAVGGDLPAGLARGSVERSVSLAGDLRLRATTHAEEQMSMQRRSPAGEGAPGAVRFRVGQVLRHRHYAYWGVIVGQPAQQTYVAEENVALGLLPPQDRRPGDGATYELNAWMRHRFPDG